jgi:hypothetical protein
MFKCPATDLWKVGIAHAPLHHLYEQGSVEGVDITWLPMPKPYCFIADPFGLWWSKEFTVFVEYLDYRKKKGEIHYYRYNSAFKLQDQGVALTAPFHLSYPFLIQDKSQIYMLPEAHKSGKLTLYKAVRFPDQWEPVADLLSFPVVDASVVFYRGLWWMFYSPIGEGHNPLKELCIAFCPTLTGEWTVHPLNPVRSCLASSRPAGTPFFQGEKLILPTQDNRETYGGQITFLEIKTLTPTAFEAEEVKTLPPHAISDPLYKDGLHTLSDGGIVTLFDVKRILKSRYRHLINIKKRTKRLLGK